VDQHLPAEVTREGQSVQGWSTSRAGAVNRGQE
jgi:hypothetical protein